MHPYSCEITVYVVFNGSTHTSFCCDFLLPYYLGLLVRMQATKKKKKGKEERELCLERQ